MKYYLLTIVCIFLTLQAGAQYPKEFANSNYGALQSVSFNPANLADSRYRFALTPFSLYADANNNFVNVRTPYSQIAAARGTLPEYQLDANGIPVFNKSFVEDRLNGRQKQCYATVEAMGPSFMLGLKDKSGVAFSTKTRVFVSMNSLNEDLLKIFLEDFDTTYPGWSPNAHQLKYKNKRNVQEGFGAGALAYQEFAFSYAAVLYDKKEHFLKGGATIKRLIGLGAAYLSVDNLDYELLEVDSIRFRGADMSGAYTSDRYYSDPDRRLYHYFGKEKLGGGWGIDIGAVYEYRPNYKDFYYRMDRRKHEDRSVNKYKFKVGASINDFGSIRFDNAPYTQRLDMQALEDTTDWSNFNSITKISGSEDIDSFAMEIFPSTSIDSSFKSALPTSFNINFDYLLADNWYASASYIQSLRGNKVKGVRKQNVFSVGGRYETRKFEASLNLVVGKFYNPVLVGTFLRWGPVYVGSDNLGGLFTPESTNGFNIFAGVQLPILHNRIPDEDGDGVSDEKDQCLGVFGSDRAKGCPDEDDDRVPDEEDRCPGLAGKKTTDGCPDPDEDGLVAGDDKCPDVYGTKENHGCPDTDNDGVPDNVDACIDEAGLAEYNGCPTPPEPEKEEKKEPETPEKIKEPAIAKKEEPVKKADPIEKPAGKVVTTDDVVDVMDFDVYDYYLILGVYKNKDLADNLVKRLNREAGILTYIYFDEGNKMNYVTLGRTTGKEEARKQLDTLSQPKVESRINGHPWWKKVPK